MNAMHRLHCTGLVVRERGASLAEYALLVGLVAVVAIGAISFLGGTAEASFERAADQISPDSGGSSGGTGGSSGGTGGSTGGTGGGDSTGGDETGGDETGGDETGGDETGGDETGGDETGGDETGGDETGGDETGGDETGGDETGGDETGGDAGTSDPPAQATTTGSGTATAGSRGRWSSEASFTIVGTDGQPLSIDGARVEVRMVLTYRDDHRTRTKTETHAKSIGSDGTVTFDEDDFGERFGRSDLSVTYQVTKVTYGGDNDDPPVTWDGEKPTVEIDAP